MMGIKNIMNDMAALEYPPIENNDLNIGIIIESKATKVATINRKKGFRNGSIRL